ncbi:Methionine aminopeptidase 1D, chloroplastic/mitochondrial [Panicum miliaceum]|uniref:Methionine aminopeptidase 1D, chloroplastic/mitochondrial n=1 Tax=Panicum miliaceum TaxID=4540 RepID=A0A3L6QLM1_PANMI|nr:Methionine aminopeptidase 1D, chloroplastic/mitochondrial [Panicum miliaceum]
MARPSSPRLLSSFLGDRLALSSRPLLLRSAVPGSRRVAYQATRTLCNLVDILFNRRSWDDAPENNPRRLRPGKVSPRLSVPNHIQLPPYVNSRQRPGVTYGPEIHDEKGIECMRASGKLAAQVLKFAGTLVKDGDIINIDVTVYLNGYHGDTSPTFLCGDVDDEAKKLVQVTKECLDKAISICAPGVEIKRIGRTIQDHADKFKFGVVRHFVGHGVGKVFHAAPVVLHFRNNEWGRMMLNQTFTIEVVESWRAEKLKDIKSASTQNQSSLDLSNEETRMLKRALEFNWRMLMEDIGLWIPEEVTHTVHDDKPENEPEEQEIIAGPPLSPQCNAELHTDYGGAAVRWGLTHHKESAADCCQACLDQAKNAKPGELKCNIWVYCPSEFGCYSPDKYEHKHQECWLKQL